ncbi:hypothetical protein MRB53_028136 [Persea americana]|uniref:Uncharacterized protein n=1 Tax=Persea americana TaxID=3435 RepID=A0ACC2KF59_PERAE|nr:hypothetical protein MRB53_028136 [Persea americana]
MDFFKSVFSNEPEPEPESEESSPNPQNASHSDPNSPTSDLPQNPNPNRNPNPASSSAWSFGGLIKTIATRSESVIETYRRDLDEFRSGLKKETEAIVDVTSRAVRDLPVSIDAGAAAAAAQAKLESVGHVIDEFGGSVWRGTAEIITHGKDALADLDDESPNQSSASASNSTHYSRFDAQVMGIQSDPGTFCDEPEDLEGFNRWKLGFVLEENEEEIENLCGDNGALEGMYSRLVPSVVDRETFWSRYFYRIHKLKLAEEARVSLVKRAISIEDDEELSWDVEENDQGETTHDTKNLDLEKKIDETPEKDAVNVDKNAIEENSNSNSNSNAGSHEGSANDGMDSAKEPVSVDGCDRKLQLVDKQSVGESNSDESVAKSDDKMTLEGKIEVGESNNDSNLSVASSQTPPHEEEDFGWDDIEDLGSIDEKKVATGATPNREYLRKRLSAADEEEDLSWDIEDDEPVKG